MFSDTHDLQKEKKIKKINKYDKWCDKKKKDECLIVQKKYHARKLLSKGFP